jgi:hypothetical protein
MKPARLPICTFLCIVLIAIPLFAAGKSEPAKIESSKSGAQIASTLSQVTGIAISPLLGVSALGGYKWMRAHTAEQKAALPWYGHPMYWITGLLIVGAVAFKDAAGTALPPGWKKPLDVLETMENKASGLVAAGAVIPFTMDTLTSMLGSGGHAAVTHSSLAMINLAAIDFSWLLQVALAPFAVAVFLIVWITAHAINVLILLSPWGAIDAVLKSIRMSVLGLVVITPHINPYLGVCCSLVVIIVSYFLAGWAFRLTIYGSVFCWDFFTRRRGRFTPDPSENWVFAGKNIMTVPLRTYGRVSRDANGKLVFRFRPWLVFAEKHASLPDVPVAVGRGMFYPTVEGTFEGTERTLLLLPPRYKNHEESFARACGINEIVNVGLRHAWGVIKELFGFGNKRRRALA